MDAICRNCSKMPKLKSKEFEEFIYFAVWLCFPLSDAAITFAARNVGIII